MGNHFHLLLETPEPTLSTGMRQLNGVYTQWFNWRHRRVGHLMQGRFKAVLVEKQTHLLELARYVVLNPVRAGLVPTAAQWRWSNYRATARLGKPPAWLEIEWTLAQFGSKKAAPTRYRKFVAEGKGSRYAPWEQLAAQIFLGGKDFRRQVQQMISASLRSSDSETPRAQRFPLRPALQDILTATAREFGGQDSDWTRKRQSPARLAVAWLARTEAGLRLSEFARGVKPCAASHLAISAQRRSDTDRTFRKHLHQIQTNLQKVTLSQT